ncbi:MAG: choice-of-anchor D domain-containing protein [Gammaproteobacteria bacterium]|nr:choice-of-anchor D domain-containing protein [Gammaproteobacteria bacterium]
MPLYAVVLSLMGAAVSMTRRVPEFQRRLSPGDPEYITYDQARERLVFQIMQVVSAPLIVLTAYYLVNPESRSSTILLSFASGFSSETVLLLIRATLDKLTPAPAAPPKLPDVRVVPARLDFGNVPVAQASKKPVVVMNSGTAELVISALACTGEFSAVTPVPVKVVPGSSGSVELEFKPTNQGPKQGQLTITDSMPGSPRIVDLAGTGT